MRQRSFNLNPPTNPFLQAVYFIVGGIALIGAILMGAVILSVALGLAIVFGLVIFVRVWWLKRQFRRRMQQSGQQQETGNPNDPDIIEVEYTVVEERDDRERRD